MHLFFTDEHGEWIIVCCKKFLSSRASNFPRSKNFMIQPFTALDTQPLKILKLTVRTLSQASSQSTPHPNLRCRSM